MSETTDQSIDYSPHRIKSTATELPKKGEDGYCEFCGGFGRRDTDKIQYCCQKAFYAYQ